MPEAWQQLASAALDPVASTKLLIDNVQLAPLCFAAWIDQYARHPQLVGVAFARIIQIVYSADIFAKECLCNLEPFVAGISNPSTSPDQLVEVLVALLRLLRHDARFFLPQLPIKSLWPLLRHDDKRIALLALYVVAYYTKASDYEQAQQIKESIGEESVMARLDEGMNCDLHIFGTWEDRRIRVARQQLAANSAETVSRSILETHPRVANLAGVLVPRRPYSATSSSFVATSTAILNLHDFAEALMASNAVLLQGPKGSGKTFLIEDVAAVLGRPDDLVRIHLGDQTDAKLLLGTYVTSATPGEFVWQAGLLTNAVKQGKWLLIEDIDRAPKEVLSVLLPLMESGQILISSRNEIVAAAPGFRLLATQTVSSSSRKSTQRMLGARLWRTVDIRDLPIDEIRQVIVARYPILSAMAETLLRVWHAISSQQHTDRPSARADRSRPLGTQDLFKWARRVVAVFANNNIHSPSDTIPSNVTDDIFSEAVDCFAATSSQLATYEATATLIGVALEQPPERVRHFLESHVPAINETKHMLAVGRASLPKRETARRQGRSRPFAFTGGASRLMEQLMVACKHREPVLLVGETGTGKTTVVQQLANILGHKLVAINMSQQTESGDLLGGFKPVDNKLLAVPIIETFEHLFEKTLSASKNAKFLAQIRRAFAKNQWRRLTTLLREACKIAIRKLDQASPATGESEVQPKRRRLDSPLLVRWHALEGLLDTFDVAQDSTQKAFRFSFVDGALVRALRNGDWVLLDEINLSSPDTLESINGLLQECPSIVITEKGDLEPVLAHPDFRLFACMNPATDVGKKDLPSSVRARFTELYVHSPDSNMQDLEAIIAKYIGGLAVHSGRVIYNIASLYIEAKKLAQENRLVDGAGQRPHYSIRTLSRTLSYAAEIAPIYGLPRALYEGFCMSFLTLLDAESEALLLPLIENHTMRWAQNGIAFLSQIPKRPDGDCWIQFKHYWLHSGPQAPTEDDRYILTPFVQKTLLNLVRASATRKYPILLQGPTSSGKTSLVEYLANQTGHQFVRINNHEHTDLQEYLGGYTSDAHGTLVFQEGLLVQAVREGHWLVLDELNLAPTDVLEALNRLLDDNRELLIPETQEVVKPHPSFMLFATQNPPGLYGGRKHLSRAFRNRFLELHVDDIPESELETILFKRCQIAPSYCKRIVEVYKRLSLQRQSTRVFEQKSSFATLRDLFRWATRPAVGYEELAINGYHLLAERVRRPEEKAVVKEVLEKVMKVELNDLECYFIEDMPEFQQLATLPDMKIVWTTSMRRLFKLLALAFRNKEPVLLVGETGCGKTTVCQMMAQALSRPIKMLNAHQNTETADLIGALRPVRNKTQTMLSLERDLAEFLFDAAVALPEDASLEQLMQAFATLDVTSYRTDDSLSLRATAMQDGLDRLGAIFAWSNGPLVEAMLNGEIFLLDEISLADDSVLERLNSVLETKRTLVLAEKGSHEAANVATHPNFQFCATMNPGGDFGKRELSPALRNRFTEIWVPSISARADIVQIVRSSLDVSRHHLCVPMIEFAEWFSNAFSSPLASSAVSIRDLLAWCAMCNHKDLDDKQAFVHGAALVYVDALGASPATGVLSETDALQAKRQTCLAMLSQFVGFECQNLYDQVHDFQRSPNSICIGPFSLPCGTLPVQAESFQFSAKTTHLNATRIFRASQLRRPILLEGSPGVGKTSLISAIAAAARRHLVRINFSEQTDLMDLFGSDAPVEDSSKLEFAWRDAPFLQAMQSGSWVLLDEMNLASQTVLEGLNACLDYRAEAYIPELGRSFKCHPDFRVFAAQNPHKQGGGRKGLPKSFLNRFTVVYCDPLGPADFTVICHKLYPSIAEEHVTGIVAFMDAFDRRLSTDRSFGSLGQPWEVNLRDMLRWLSIFSSLIEDNVGRFGQVIIRERFRTKADRKVIGDLLSMHFGPQSLKPPSSVSLTHEVLTIGMATALRSLEGSALSASFTGFRGEHNSALESILHCVNQRWPCILTGPSGSGKSTLIRNVASVLGRELRCLTMTSDMDASDLLGSFEQRDIVRAANLIMSKARKPLLDFLRSPHEWSMTLLALDALHVLDAESFDTSGRVKSLQSMLANLGLATDVQANLLALLSEMAEGKVAHFQWADGSLVRALKDGSWVLLDNANLCSPSVLDRLNSLLETDGVLIVNERVLDDGQPMTIVPHKDFRLFLTVDPQNGELSRAMRNRGIEVFLPTLGQSTQFLVSCQSEDSRWTAVDRIVADSAIQINQIFTPTDAAELLVRDTHRLGVSRSLPVISAELAVLEAMQAFEIPESTSNTALTNFEYGRQAYFIREQSIAPALKFWKESATENGLATSLTRTKLRYFDALDSLLSTTMSTCKSEPVPIVAVRKWLRLAKFYLFNLASDSLSFDRACEFLNNFKDLLDNGITDSVNVSQALLRNLHNLPLFRPVSRGQHFVLFWERLSPSLPRTNDAATFSRALRRTGANLDHSVWCGAVHAGNAIDLQRVFLGLLQKACVTTDITPFKEDALIASGAQMTEHAANHVQDAEWTSVYESLSNVILFSQLRDFNVWHGVEMPSFAVLCQLRSLAQRPSAEMLALAEPVDKFWSNKSARWLSSSNLALQDWLSTQSTDSSAIDRYMALLIGIENGEVGKLPQSLASLKFIASQICEHSGDLLMDACSSKAQILLIQIKDFVEIVCPELTKLDPYQIAWRLVLEGSKDQYNLSAIRQGIVSLMPSSSSIATSFWDKAFVAAIEAQDSAFKEWVRHGRLGSAFVYFAMGFADMYIPAEPRDPAALALFKRDFSEWCLAHHRLAVSCQGIIGKHLNGMVDSELSPDQAAELVSWQADAVDLSKAPPLRPETSQMPHISVELEFLADLLSQNGDAAQVHALFADDVDYDNMQARTRGLLQTLERLQIRLMSFADYADILVPAVALIVQLRVGFHLLSTALRTAQSVSSTLPVPSADRIIFQPLSRQIVKQDMISTASDTLQNPGIEILAQLKRIEFRFASGLIHENDLNDIISAFGYVVGQHFQAWYLARDAMAKIEAEAANLFKNQVVADDSQDAHLELFPDYTGTQPVQSTVNHRGINRKISDEHSRIVHLISHRSFEPGKTSTRIIDALDAFLQSYISSLRCADSAGGSQLEAQKLTIATYYAQRLCVRMSMTRTQWEVEELYDFYRSENPSETQQVIPLLLQLQDRIKELITAWPENAILVDLQEAVEHLLGAPITIPVAQLLTMFEQAYSLMYQWQEVASREFGIQALLEEVRLKIVDWRRYELSCWPQLFQLEEFKTREADSEIWFNLYELTILVPSKQKVIENSFVIETVSALLQFLRSASVGQFSGRLDYLTAFSLHLPLIADGGQSYASFANAIENVANYFAEYRTVVQQFVLRERKVLAKEVSEIIKLASWKDTNVFALRESSRRSHRQLYKLVHKYRRVLNTPVESILQGGLSSLMPKVSESKFPAMRTFCHVENDRRDRPLRFQNPHRTADRLQCLMSKNKPSSNRLVLFVDETLALAEGLRKETPSVYRKEEESQVKHLKTRKRKLLSDSFKALKALGLKPTMKPEKLSEQRSQEALFLNTHVLQPNVGDNLDKFFHLILDLLPQIRNAQTYHSDEISSAEVKRAVGYFDCFLDHVLQHRTTLASFHSRREELKNYTAAFYQLAQKPGPASTFSMTGASHAGSSPRIGDAALKFRILSSMVDFIELTCNAHIHFTKPATDLRRQAWWQQGKQDLIGAGQLVTELSANCIVDEAAVQAVTKFDNACRDFSSQLQNTQHSMPDLAHHFYPLIEALQQTPRSHITEPELAIPNVTVSEIEFQSAADAILSAVQNAVQVSPTQPNEATFSAKHIAYTRHLAALSLISISTRLALLADKVVEACQTGSADDISTLVNLCTVYSPIFSAFEASCEASEEMFRHFAEQTAYCIVLLGRTFATLAQEGFCGPQESDKQPGESKETTDGTGLADGRGNEDITKDIEDDEDIGDLEESGSPQEKDDANQVDAKELEDDVGGDLESIQGDQSDDHGSDDGGEDEQHDEEVGEVDDADPTAVDEKMWDEEKDDARQRDETQREEQGSRDGDIDLVNQKEDDRSRSEANQPQNDDAPADDDGEDDLAEQYEDETEDRDEPENRDATQDLDQDQVPQAENLDLPEDLDLDDGHASMSDDTNSHGDEDMDVDVAETEELTAEIQTDGGDDIEDSNDDEEHQLDAQMDDLESSIDEMEKPHTVPDEESATKVEESPDDEHDEHGTGAEEGGTDILHTKDLSQEGKATAEDDDSEMTNLPDEFETPEHDVTSGTGVEQSRHQDDAVNQSTDSQGASTQAADQLRSLGDHLEQFRRMLHIEDASTQVDTDQELQSRIAESQGDVEHVGPDINTSDQAMGPSTEEPEGLSADHDRPLPDLEEDIFDEAVLPAEEVDDRLAQDEHIGQALAAENASERAETSEVLQERNGREQSLGASNDVQSTDADMLEAEAKQAAGAIWQQHERATRDLANGLCEQLRLILEPTLATRLQGDFRTGKRLNMRRIIPYIASQFKKDKIWLRRNRPSKRQYQVMLAIDNSKSMAESGSVPLAFDTLALVSTALSVLEVGSISVVKFAARPEIVHDFKDSFSSDAGANIFGSFTFDENQTNVKALAAQSLEVFRNARTLQSGDAEDLWQLQIIISDGICDDHESIRRLLRQAHEERIMVVFVVLDTIHGNKKNSIMQMNQVKSVVTPDGTKTLKIQSYMEDFASAFENFLIIQHVSDLPELLCSTIRQFFVGVSSS